LEFEKLYRKLKDLVNLKMLICSVFGHLHGSFFLVTFTIAFFGIADVSGFKRLAFESISRTFSGFEVTQDIALIPIAFVLLFNVCRYEGLYVFEDLSKKEILLTLFETVEAPM
jgi:hypothetical protein